jgi:glyoxylase-like metal-dependent hydrolase (beta-lactamase superfamily II)
MPTIHTYRSSETGLFVNSYLIESDGAVVVVDAPLLLSDGRAFRARLDALRKPLAGVVVTHPHPDHYNTITQVVDGTSAPIIALPRVDRIMRDHDDAKRQQWAPVFGDEWPASATFANEQAADGSVVELGGIRLRAYDLGRGESESETAWLLDDAAGEPVPVAFIGDLAFNGSHPYLADGMTGEWLDSLDRARSVFGPAHRLYIGHGEPVGLDGLQAQRSYLLMVREAIHRLSGDSDHLEPGAKEELQRLMAEFWPGAPLVWLLGAGCDAVAAELAGERASR